MTARKATFSGSWYPADTKACEQAIKAFIEGATTDLDDAGPFVGGIVPHAGWFYSGDIACRVIRLLVEETPPDLILIFGMHLPPGAPNYIMTEGSWETPFGDIPIAEDIAKALTQEFSFKIETSTHFTPDNTIELQLPFIKYFFNQSKIIPIGVPPNRASFKIGTAAAAMAKAKGMRLKVIGSTDLTHYGSNYGFMPKGTGAEAVAWVKHENDRKAIDAMLAMDPDKILDEAESNLNACCSGAVATAVAAAKEMGAQSGQLVAYTTSHDKSPGDNLVGYAGVVF
jgi:AmmeMemoRadiSam system protein B